MRRTVCGFVCGAAALVAGYQVAAQELIHLPMDDAAALATSLATDTEIKAEGPASVRVATGWPTVVNLAEVAVPDVEAVTLVYTARVRASQLVGTAYLEMWAHVGGGQYFSRGLDSTVAGDAEWTELRTVFVFQAGQRPDKVTLNLVINGAGTVWVDDVRLARAPLP